MPLETPTFVGDFVQTNPTSGDARSEGDDHIRNLKIALQNTFPGMAGRSWRSQSKSSTYTVVPNDNMTVIDCTAGLTLNLTAAATLGNGHLFIAAANGGDVTVDPNGAEVINGAATVVVPNGQTAIVLCSGTAFKALFIPTYTPAWSAGDVKATFKSVADPGWVLMNDGSIGSASSGATTRANADTLAVYTVLWNSVSDTWAPVAGGRGASAAADFAANKAMTLPKVLGRALASAGAGAGLSARVLGQSLGSENAVLVSHSHGGNTGFISADHTHNTDFQGDHGGHVTATTSALVTQSTSDISVLTSVTLGNAGSHQHATGGVSSNHVHSITAEGVSATGANMPPEIFMNFLLKL